MYLRANLPELILMHMGGVVDNGFHISILAAVLQFCQRKIDYRETISLWNTIQTLET